MGHDIGALWGSLAGMAMVYGLALLGFFVLWIWSRCRNND